MQYRHTVPLPLISLLLLLSGCAAAQPAPATNATATHFEAIVIDTHADTLLRLVDPDFDLRRRHHDGHIDIPRMREGGLDAVFFAIWIPPEITGAEAVKRAMAQIESLHWHIRLNSDDMVLATSAEEVEKAYEEGRIAALIGMEGGQMIDNDLAMLRRYFDLGVRYLTLTHNLNVDWADSSTDKPQHGGLTDSGREIVREMNRLGMIIDVSHVSDDTFYDVLAVSQAPVIASHSSSRALSGVPRNMSDAMIRALATAGGVIHINYHVEFLSQAFHDAMSANDDRVAAAFEMDLEERCGEDIACQVLEGDQLVREYVDAGKLPRVEWTEIIDHIDHAVQLVGADHVGLGSDFDGAFMPYGMEDASKLPRITQALVEKGYSAEDIRKILGGNTLRVMRDVEAVAGQMAR